MSFHLGQHVVCCIAGSGPLVPGFTGKKAGWPDAITNGTVLTVRDIDTRLALHGCPIALRFEEYHHPLKENGWEIPFPSEGFRPLSETRLDIFHQMLVSPPKVEELIPVVFSDQEPS